MIKLRKETLESHFPTMVMVRDYEGAEALNCDLEKTIKELSINLGQTNQNAATNGDSTTKGGFQTPADMVFLDLKNESVSYLKNHIILPAIEEYLLQVFNVDPLYTPFKVKSWANRLGEGDWQSPHMHPKEYTLISGIYYVEVPETLAPAGHLEFINPALASVAIGGQMSSRLHQPINGQVLLFPPHYMHFVHPMAGKAIRSVIAFDVSLEH